MKQWFVGSNGRKMHEIIYKLDFEDQTPKTKIFSAEVSVIDLIDTLRESFEKWYIIIGVHRTCAGPMLIAQGYIK